jgi:hypothetical protein
MASSTYTLKNNIIAIAPISCLSHFLFYFKPTFFHGLGVPYCYFYDSCGVLPVLAVRTAVCHWHVLTISELKTCEIITGHGCSTFLDSELLS